jgi:hypothetical protein
MIAAASSCVPDGQFRAVYRRNLRNQLRDFGRADTGHGRGQVHCTTKKGRTTNCIGNPS